MGSEPSSAPTPAHRSGWTSAKIIGLIVIIIVLASSGGAGFSYYVLRPAATLPKGQCSNNATNYPSCNTCASGSTFTGGACYTNCSNGATNPPACNKYPSCSNGGANPPTCTPPCNNGASNPPLCDNQSNTIVQCSPSLIEAKFTYSTCTVSVYADINPVGSALIACYPLDSSGSPECDYTPSGPCVLMSGTTQDVSSCSFDVRATGLSLTVNVTYTGEQINGARVLMNSTGTFKFTVTQPPSSVVVTGKVTSTVLVSYVTGIEFTSGGANYRGMLSSGMYNVTLTNFTTYSVKIYYSTANLQSGSCNAGTLNLANASGKMTVDYQC